MERTVISQDTTTGLAEIKFVHNGVTVQTTFDLKKVIPGSENVLAAMGLTFTEEYQTKAMDYLTASIQRQIEEGVIVNPPVVDHKPLDPATLAPEVLPPEPDPIVEQPVPVETSPNDPPKEDKTTKVKSSSK